MIGRVRELSFLENGLGVNGTLRVAFLYGQKGVGKSFLIENLAKRLIQSNHQHLIATIKGEELKSFSSILASLGRNLLAGNEIDQRAMHDLGRKLGSAIIGLENQFRDGLGINEFKQKIAEVFIELTERALDSTNTTPLAFTPILIFEDLELVPEALRDWFSQEFNQSMRKSKFFKNTRFLLSSNLRGYNFDSFFANFGFSNPQEIILSAFSESECVKFAHSNGITEVEGKSLRKQSGGIPSKLLKLLNKSSKLISNDPQKMSESQKKTKINTSEFSEQELSRLLFASYPTRINRYNLEFFCSPKDAAFCFNWLKRKPDVARNAGDGDLFLDENLRRQIREFHKQEEPEEAEKMDVLASVLDAFIELFPDPNSHWIPLNLQLFNSFSKELCEKIFNEMEYEEILAFLDNHDAQFEKFGKFYRMNEDSKLVTKRFIEVSGAQLDDELIGKIQHQWDLDQDRASEKKLKLEQEQKNFQVEIGDIETQINSLASVKEDLMKDFKNPIQAKPQKIYSFSSSSLLIVLGLGTIGASLFSDLIGSYHAACGIALTLFGFFWPSVEVKKQKVQNVGGGPKLAIETQHRSMDHRIKGLANRANFINSSLEQLSKDIEGLNQGINEPYFLTE